MRQSLVLVACLWSVGCGSEWNATVGQPEDAGGFAEYDRDGNGKLVDDEIPVWLKNSSQSFDANGDGEIEAEEFQARMSQLRGGSRRGGPGGGRRGGRGAPGGGDPTMMFANMDKNGDGVLAGEEIREGMREAMDVNGDGEVTQRELLTRMRERRAEWRAAARATEQDNAEEADVQPSAPPQVGADTDPVEPRGEVRSGSA